MKERQILYIQEIIENDHEKANNKVLNLTQIETILFIQFVLKLLELIFLIFSMSFLFCILWLILCGIEEDFIYDTDLRKDEITEDLQEQFIVAYDMQFDSDGLVFLKAFYFAFTSLTTVGFGDFHPKSSLERLLCSFMILFGVLVFSYIMNEYVALLE